MGRKRKKHTPAQKRKREQKRAKRRKRKQHKATTPQGSQGPLRDPRDEWLALTDEWLAPDDDMLDPRRISCLETIPPWYWSDQAIDFILDVLVDDSAALSDRGVAARLAGHAVRRWNEIAPVLLEISRNDDEPDELRGRAAISLGPMLEHGYIEGLEDEDLIFAEEHFHRIVQTLHELHARAETPDLVRRCVLEAAVRAPREWHRDAVRAAYSHGERDWKLTAVFAMRFIDGFEHEIVESLNSPDPDIQYEAIGAADHQRIDAAWDHLVSLLGNDDAEKHLRLAAIEAVASIRPDDAGIVLSELADTDDEDIAEAVQEAMDMAAVISESLDGYGALI